MLLFVPASYLYRFWVESAPLREGRDYARAPVQDIQSDWALYGRLEGESRLLGSFSPARWLKGPFRAALIRGGKEIVEEYRNSSDPAIEDFDWEKGRVSFSRALELEPSDKEAKGGLALCEGYLSLGRDPKSPQRAELEFREAERCLPKSPDPHLGLARIYGYAIHNAGQSVAEFNAAERLGFTPGPREYEAEADAYLFRAEQEVRAGQQQKDMAARRRLLALAQRDFTRARNLYEPIAGFSKASNQL